MIVEEIRERRRILERNIYSINLDQCAHRDIILFRSEDIWDKYRFKLEQEILSLEENKTEGGVVLLPGHPVFEKGTPRLPDREKGGGPQGGFPDLINSSLEPKEEKQR